jgi:hypothetical protein
MIENVLFQRPQVPMNPQGTQCRRVREVVPALIPGILLGTRVELLYDSIEYVNAAFCFPGHKISCLSSRHGSIHPVCQFATGMPRLKAGQNLQ